MNKWQAQELVFAIVYGVARSMRHESPTEVASAAASQVSWPEGRTQPAHGQASGGTHGTHVGPGGYGTHPWGGVAGK